MNRERIAALGLFWLQTLLIAQYSGQGGLEFTLGGIAVASLWLRLELSIGKVIAGVLAMIVVGILLQIGWPPDIQFDWILPGYYVIGFCRIILLIQLLLLFKRPNLPGQRSQPRDVEPAFFGFALWGIMACFCRAESTLGGTFFAVAILAMVFFLLAFSVPSTQATTDRTPSKRKSMGPLVFACLAILVGTGFAGSLSKQVLGALRGFTSQQIADRSLQYDLIMYSSTGELSNVSNLKLTDPNRIALDLTCKVAPGYLRGKAFSDFSGQRWSDSAGEVDEQEALRVTQRQFRGDVQPLLENGFKCYDISAGSIPPIGPFRSLQINRRDGYLGNVTFTPSDTHLVSTNSDRVKFDRHAVLANRLKREYHCYVSNRSNRTQLDRLTSTQLVALPSTLSAQVNQLADEVMRDAQTDRERMEAIERYFRTEHEYSLSSSQTKRRDRISEFILEKQAGHCELFATAAAIMLRTQGIPTRYVTGYATIEPSSSDDNEDLWVARNCDAHAWAEAYDRQRQKWIIVEATPGANFPKSLWQEELITSSGGGTSSDNLSQANSRGGIWEFLNAVSRYLASLFESIQTSLLIPTLLLVLTTIVYLVWRWRSSRMVTHYGYQPQRKRMQQLERKLHQLNLQRRPSETLHQFANRLLAFEGDDAEQVHEVHAAALEITVYAEHRYRSVC